VAFVIDANLDCEAKWSGLPLGAPVLGRISLYGTLLTALAPRGEAVELWTPVAIDRSRVRMGGVVTFRVGTPPSADLRWADPAAKAANDRRLARKLGALPGSFVVEGASSDPWPTGLWIAKAVWSAAGRDRCRGDGAPKPDQTTRMMRLLDACGALVVEPWCDRVLDVGVCASVDATGDVTAEAPHGLLVDSRGGFLGIDLAAPKLEPADAAQLAESVQRAGSLLREVGYAGPFAVDAFVHRVNGQRALHVCEINARYSFGWVARAFARRSGCTKLGFGPPPIEHTAAERATILIENRDDNIVAWLA
jgi:hypothetical protein